MDLGLKVVGGVPGEGRTVTLPRGRRLLRGRHGRGIDLRLESLTVNLWHWEVGRDGAGVVGVVDNQSRNGTQVNGPTIPTDEPHRLLPCDRLRLGQARLRLAFLGP